MLGIILAVTHAGIGTNHQKLSTRFYEISNETWPVVMVKPNLVKRVFTLEVGQLIAMTRQVDGRVGTALYSIFNLLRKRQICVRRCEMTPCGEEAAKSWA